MTYDWHMFQILFFHLLVSIFNYSSFKRKVLIDVKREMAIDGVQVSGLRDYS